MIGFAAKRSIFKVSISIGNDTQLSDHFEDEKQRAAGHLFLQFDQFSLTIMHLL